MLLKKINFSNLNVLFISLVAFFVDQFSKNQVLENLTFFIDGYQVSSFMNLVFVTNKGISFGLLSNYNMSFYLGILSLIICLVIVYWILKSKEKKESIPLSLILGGALGNGFDRLKDNYVIDFLDFHVLDFHWPAFNLADSFITIGAVLFIFLNLLKKNE